MGEVTTHPLISLYHGGTAMSKIIFLSLVGIVVTVILVKLTISIIKEFNED